MKKLFIKTYGCQMNVYDSDKMLQLLKPLGYELTEDVFSSDIAVLNTCHIREKAEHKMFSDLGRYRLVQKEREDQGERFIIAVAGCVAQAQGDEILKQAPFVDLIFGPQSYHLLPQMLAQVLGKRGEKVVSTEFPVESKFDYIPVSETSQASAFLSIQEGCDKFCTYCVVPYTRGVEYSRPVEAILREVRLLVDQGVREITLLGQNVNAYHGASSHVGDASKSWNLARLIESLATIEGLDRIRYTTSHPKDMDEDLIRSHGDVEKLMPFLHLPVQSGSDKILKKMNRQHSISLFKETIQRLRERRSGIAFSTDLIVGFPGETEQDFKSTLDLVEQTFFAQAYSFKFSRRPGTPADLMDDQVDENVKAYRLEILQSLLRRQQLEFNQSNVGKTVPVLFEKEGRYLGQIVGRSPFMQSVYVEGDLSSLKKIGLVHIEKASLNALSGNIVGDTF